MLAKAVQQHDSIAPPPRKPTTPLAQQLFPSSSPIASQAGTKSPFRNPLPPNSVLRPSASSVVNGKLGSKNPLKRTASHLAEMGSYISRQSSEGRSKQTSIFSQDNFVDLTQTTQVSTAGVVGKLHEGIYFDENDFIDDADLDLDGDDTPFVLPNSHPVTYPALPSSGRDSSSGVPLQWSSSPLQHKAAPPNALIQPPSDVYPHLPQESFRPTKRRKLPWLGTDVQDTDPHKNLVHQLQTQGKEQKTTKEAYTPLPKNKQSESPYPWNKTASAVKEEQKQRRQQANQGKKIVKSANGIANNGSTAVKTSKSNTKDVNKVHLSSEQKKVLKLVVDDGKSVFFTGSAGTGKSVLMREIIRTLRMKHQREPDRVAVTASTGLAACNVGGVTLHSFAGIGLGKEDVPTLVKKIKRNQKAKQRWQRTKVLVIDEISMVDGDLFDKLEAIARSIRSNGRPFGGIQLVITGDFFQLPPVPDAGRTAKFAFDAATWTTSINHTIGLTQVFRQKDPVFANMLNEMRLGRLSQESIAAFRKLSRNLDFQDDLEATELWPTRLEVENANNVRMRNLGGSAVVFDAEDGGAIQDISQRERLLMHCMAPPKITLKKGAQVMLIKNIDDSLVNGSLGKVAGFMDEKTFDYYHENEEQFYDQTQEVEDEDMSRAKLNLKNLLNVDQVGSTAKKWPVVRFHLADGTSRDLLCQRETWKIELPNGEVQAFRSQIPLILAWALSIHKAQGQTLERVKVDLGKTFEKGQVYVALSRATCQEGLQITRFDPKKVMAHEKVTSFYNSLYGIELAARSAEQVANEGRKPEKISGQLHSRGNTSYEDDEDALAQMYG